MMLWTLALPMLLATSPPPETGWHQIAAGLPVVEVDLTESTECFPFLVDRTNAYYCDKDRAIYLGSKYAATNGTALFMVFHELGHAQYDHTSQWFEPQFIKEQRADCVAGQYMREHPWVTEKDREDARALLRSQQPSESHGTAQERLAAFDGDRGVCPAQREET